MNTLPTTPTSFAAATNSASVISGGNHHIHRVNSKTNPAHSLFAGWLAGFSGTIVGYPLDSAKVWYQTNTMGKNKYWGGAKASSSGSKKGLNDNTARNSSSACAKHGNNVPRDQNVVSSLSSKVVYGTKRSSSSAAAATTTTASAGAKINTPHQNKPIKTFFRTVRALYSGASSPLITVGMVQSVNFATYDATRQFLYRRQLQQNDNYIDDNNNINNREYLTQDSLAGVAISGSVAGMVTGILTAPLIMIKINQQITGNPFRVALKETFVLKQSQQQQQQGRRPRLSIISEFRFRPYGAAFIPHILSESFSRAMYVATYEGLKRYLLVSKEVNNHDVNNNNNMNMNGIISLSLQERMACAASSGILCWAIFFPFDSLRSRMYHAASQQKQQQHHILQKQPQQQSYSIKNMMNSNTIVESIRIMRKERSFYRGFSISLLRAGPVAAAVLPVYDLTLEWLSSSSY
jgi:hypothetical protein